MSAKIHEMAMLHYVRAARYLNLAMKADIRRKPGQFARLMSKSSFERGKCLGPLEALDIITKEEK